EQDESRQIHHLFAASLDELHSMLIKQVKKFRTSTKVLVVFDYIHSLVTNLQDNIDLLGEKVDRLLESGAGCVLIPHTILMKKAIIMRLGFEKSGSQERKEVRISPELAAEILPWLPRSCSAFLELDQQFPFLLILSKAN